VILQQEIAREQMAKLLENGRTDLLTNFKSSRTGRNFKAFLVKQSDGKIGFEFEKKEPKEGAAKKTAAKSAAKAAPESANDEAANEAPAKKVAAKTAAAKKAPAKKAATKTTAAKTAARKTGS
jgi:DNA topoisomerase-3